MSKRSYVIIKKTLAFLLAAVLTFVLAASAAAADRGAEKRVVRVACGINQSLYLDENGEAQGYCADYLETLANISRWQLEYVNGSLNESIQNLRDGKVDIVFPLQKTEEREQSMAFSELSGGYQTICLYAPEDSGMLYNDYSAFDGARVAMTEGSSNESAMSLFAENHGFSYVPVYIDSRQGKTEAVNNGEADCIAASTVYDPEHYLVVATLSCVPFYYAVDKDNSELLEQLNSGMEQIMTEQPELVASVGLSFLDTGARVAHTRAESEWLKNDGKIVVGVYKDTPPLYHGNEGEEAHGIYIDLIALLSAKTGADIELYPIGRDSYAYDLMEEGVIDVVLGSNDTSLKAMGKSGYVFSAPILDYTTVTISRHDYVQNESPVYVLTSARKYWEPLITQKWPDAKIQYCTNAKDCLLAVQEGKADLTLLNAWEFNYQSKNVRFSDLIEWENNRIQGDIVMVTKAEADETMVSILDKGISELGTDELSEILTVNINRQYDDYTFSDEIHIYRNVIIGISVLLALLAAFLIVYNYMRKKYVRRLEKNNSELRKANEAKTDFLARMSHDMRTPMNGILGLSYIMEDQNDIAEMKKELPKLRESGEYLLQLINDVLDVNKVESGKIELHPRACDGRQIFDSVLSLIRPQMEEKSIEFKLETVNVHWRHMMLDEQRVKQIFVNLLSNAVKFTPEGGKIELVMETVSEEEHMLRDKFIVRDSGIGMSEEFLPKVFEPFVQENRVQTGLGGTGLGLPIVKNLVELMGGSISVKSKINEGTEFTLFLNFPLAEGPDEDDGAEEGRARKGMPRGLKILLCEDHPLNAQIAVRLLEKQEASVTWAENGRLGVEAFENSEPGYYDAILMDIRMPVMDGLEAARAIRAMERPDAKTVPMIAMTANAYDDDIKKSLEAGMSAHLAKPVEPDKLYETLAELCGG